MSADQRQQKTAAYRLDMANPAILQDLWELQRAAYAVEAELIGFDGIPALHETLQELRDCGEYFLCLDDEIGLAGAVSWTRQADGTVEICRLVVHPRAHRQGIATKLLDSLDDAEPTDLTIVSTGTANHPAIALYRRRGFILTGTRQIAPEITITLLERQCTTSPAEPSIHTA
jgi:ribosomal protein S18 acetylase RimI-like enzyme